MAFFEQLRGRRKSLDANLVDKDLVAAREEDAKLTARLADIVAQRPTHSSGMSAEEKELREEHQVVRQRVADLRRRLDDANGHAKDYDRLLLAPTHKADAMKRAAQISAQIAKLEDRVKQLAKVEGELGPEVEELEQKCKAVAAKRGADEVEARVRGERVATGDALSALERDLASRREALSAAREAKVHAESQLTGLRKDLGGAEHRCEDADGRVAEIEFYDLLPKLAPIVARMSRANSPLVSSYFADHYRLELRLEQSLFDELDQTMRAELLNAKVR